MTLESEVVGCWQKHDDDAALALLRDVFSSGRARAEGATPLQQGFDGIRLGFQPVHTIDQRGAGVCQWLEDEQADTSVRPETFGALVYRVHHFDHTETFVDAQPVDPSAGEPVQLYWPPGEHNITFQDDWKDDFAFVSALCTRGAYELTHRGAPVPGALAHYLLRGAVLVPWLRRLSERLRGAPRFQRIPRATSFRFIAASVPHPKVPASFFFDL